MSKHASMPPTPTPSASSSSSSSGAARTSAARRAGAKRMAGDGKQLMFSHVEVIPDCLGGKAGRAATGAVSHSSSKLKRSPTPVLTSLTELTNAHFHQLGTVWNEQSLPSFESDKRAIAATRLGEKDPFDF